MPWITTDTDVACTLTVSKMVGDQSLPGYPKQYSILDTFDDLPAITVEDWHKMLYSLRMARISAFKSYVGRLEMVDVNAAQTNDVFRPSTEMPGTIVEP